MRTIDQKTGNYIVGYPVEIKGTGGESIQGSYEVISKEREIVGIRTNVEASGINPDEILKEGWRAEMIEKSHGGLAMEKVQEIARDILIKEKILELIRSNTNQLEEAKVLGSSIIRQIDSLEKTYGDIITRTLKQKSIKGLLEIERARQEVLATEFEKQYKYR